MTGRPATTISSSVDLFRRRLVLIAAAGFLLRLAVVQWVPTQPASDFWGYYHRALNLIEIGKYEAIRGRVEANYPPLYPLTLIPALLTFPTHQLGAAKLVNAALGAAAILLAGCLARRLGGDRAGVIAASVLAFLPRALLMTCLIASENLFSPLFLAFAWVLIEALAVARSGRYAAGGGLLLGLAALTRTVAYYLGPIWLVGALFSGKRWRRALGETLLVLFVQHAVMLPWALRNLRELGRFSFLNTAGGYGLYLGNNPKATGNWYEGVMDLERISPGVIARGPIAVSDLSNELAWKWIRENPKSAFRLYLVKFGIIFRQTFIMASFAVNGVQVTPPVPGIDVLPGPHFLKSHGRLLNGTLWATGWLLVAVGAVGWLILAARAVRSRRPSDIATALVLPAVTLYIPLTSALIAVNGRYRWPVEDLLVPAAALALAVVARRLTRSSEPRPA